MPVLTRSGRAFASRMAGALLTAAGLPQLITSSQEEYENLAIRLALDSACCIAYRKHLILQREQGALFDTKRFVLNFEKILSSL